MTPTDLLALVQCPPAALNYTPREQASPSALQQYAACKRSWGERYLHGRRETSLTWAEASALPEPPKPARGCSAVERATLEAAKRAWNKVRRPALGTEVHAILAAYMTQNTPGHWRPPMAWREIDWTSHAGRIARPAADVLPDPRGLVAVYMELAAEVEAPAGWVDACDVTEADAAAGEHERALAWPRMPGFYDLITVEVGGAGRGPGSTHWHHYRLWDFKTTSSFDWAKTADELADDPQVLLYALHAMQTFGLDQIECNWLYLRTEGSPAHYLVTITVTRAEAEQAVIEMARTAAEVVETVRKFRLGLVRVGELDQDISACKAYGGCVYHTDKGGPCDARVSQGKALKQAAALEAKITARKLARKETTMALSFEERKKQRDAAKANGEAATGDAGPTGGTSTAPAAEAGTASAAESAAGGGADESAKASAATAKLRGPRNVTKASTHVSEGVSASVDGFSFDVPAGSALGKALAKAAKGLQAAAAAFEGE